MLVATPGARRAEEAVADGKEDREQDEHPPRVAAHEATAGQVAGDVGDRRDREQAPRSASVEVPYDSAKSAPA